MTEARVILKERTSVEKIPTNNQAVCQLRVLIVLPKRPNSFPSNILSECHINENGRKTVKKRQENTRKELISLGNKE